MGHQGKRNKASSKAGSAVSGKLSSIIGRTSALYFLRNPGDGRRTRFNIRHRTFRSSSAHLTYTVAMENFFRACVRGQMWLWNVQHKEALRLPALIGT